MIDKLIKARIVEIMVVIVLVLVTIPVWQMFSAKIGSVEVKTLDDYNLNFDIANLSYTDRIIVDNPYNLNKNYKIYLVSNSKINNNATIMINNEAYKISDFINLKKGSKYSYTLIDSNIAHSRKTYDIAVFSSTDNINYNYIFEENSIV